MTRRRRTMSVLRPALAPVAVALMTLGFTGCGGDGSSNDAAATLPPLTTLAASTSTLPVSDDSTTATTVGATVAPATVPTGPGDPTGTGATTSLPPATVPVSTAPVVSLPVPIAAPVDSRGDEPVIDLGTIEIPKIGVNTTLYEGIRLTTLDRGPGHWPGTAMPGQLGNAVVAGHRVSHDKPFRKVDQLVAGDQVIFTTADGRFVYAVTSLEIVAPDAIRIIDQTPERTATLFACHPPGSTRERIVVHLALVEG